MVVYAIWHEINVRRVGEPSQTALCLIARLDKLIRNIITSIRRRDKGKHEKTNGNLVWKKLNEFV